MKLSSAVVALTLALPAGAWAQTQLTIQDDFTQAAAQNNWVTYDGACLTAGNGTGTVPACVGLPYYQQKGPQTLVGGQTGTLPDTPGNGALRLTNGPTPKTCTSGFTCGFNQAGGIVSNYTFNAGTGVNVIFKTVTYRGDSRSIFSGKGDGADGMSFFLTDAISPYDTGAFGGSLGYTCSNRNNDPTLRADSTPRQYDGLRRGYIGLGIDEWGNFLNGPVDSTATGYGPQPGRIGLRGAGSIAWYSLNHDAATSADYPSSLTLAQQAAAVQNTCKTGHIWDYTNPVTPVDTGVALPDYAPIPNAFKILSGVQIANEAAVTRADAVPIAYQLKITQNGLLSFSYSYNGGAYQPVITKQDITAGNGPLPPTLRFGFAGSTGGSTNIHEILCFQASPADLAATSVGVNEKEATKIASGTQAFLAFYYPNDWTGRLTANDLLFNSGTNQVTVNTTANWDASCNLTGAAPCASTGAASVTAQGPGSRTILTWNGTTGIPFEWNKLTAAQQTTLDLGDATSTANRLNYLRGDRSNEINTLGVGLYRARDSVLGDIVDSSPTWVGPPGNPYSLVWKDHLYPAALAAENGTNTYTAFTATEQTRTNVVYTGANDGLLHGFRAGSYDVNNNYVSTSNDGQEVLAYMPNAVLQAIHQYSLTDPNAAALDYSNAQYAHSFYVDATPASDDLFYSGAWHTWVVGGLGAGGSALYALDVTNPANFNEANAATTVLGEWTPTTITCVASVNLIGSSTCGNSLGNTYGVPVIRRLHNGNWAVIFGNGYGSVTGDAGIFVMVVSSGGTESFYYIGTGVTGCTPAPCTGINGIASPAPADLDADHITDYVYAGDLLGNVWRFDLTNSDPTQWTASPTPLFTDPAGHPITTKIMVVSTTMPSGPPRILLAFGTGRKIPLTNTTPQSYASGTHELYGIWDWNQTSWNSKSATQYASLASIPSAISLSTLQQQTLTTNATSGAIDNTSNSVCWAMSTPACTTSPQYGWYITLPGASEQVVFNPLAYLSALIVNTTIPANNSLLSCKTLTDTGNTIAISVSTGGAIAGLFPHFTDTAAVGGQTNASGSPFIVLAGGGAQILTQTLGNLPVGSMGPFSCTGPLCSASAQMQGPSGKRLTWIERR